jgi:hypothetical protein
MLTAVALALIWFSCAVPWGIVGDQWGKTAAFAMLPLFCPIALIPGLGQ